MITLIYIANSNVLELSGLKSAVEDEIISDAIVTVTLKNAAGSNVTGQTWPTTMDPVTGTPGLYRAILKNVLQLTSGVTYTASIQANGGADRVGHWELPLRAATRT